MQFPEPEHTPPQPINPLLALAVSERVIEVLRGKLAEQVPGQLMPLGLLVTVPLPASDKVNVAAVEVELNVGLTVSAAVTFTVQVLVPEQLPPLQPANVYPAEEFAQRCAGPCQVEIVPNCDHFYGGREDAVTGIVTRWLSQVMDKT